MSNNLQYREYCSTNPDIPIFFQDWWLDTVCGSGNWESLVLKSGDFVKAIWPLPFNTYSFNRKYYSMPVFTPGLGVFINYPEEQKNCTRLSYEKEVMSELISMLGNFDFFGQNFYPKFTNWLPFYWAGFSQTTRYTYRINNLSDLELVFSNFQDNIRREIRKAIKRGVIVEETDDFNLFFELHKKTFDRQNLQLRTTLSFLQNINNVCEKKQCRKILIAKDENGDIHAGAFLVWDNHTLYYLIGGGDPVLRTSGATSLLMWKAIQFAAKKVECFDFEGSVIEPIERYFRSFGAEQTPYHSISKITQKELRMRRLIKLKVKIWK